MVNKLSEYRDTGVPVYRPFPQKSHKVTTFFGNLQIFCAKSAIFLTFLPFSLRCEGFYAIFEAKSSPQRLAIGAYVRFSRSAGRPWRYFAADLLFFGTPGYRYTGIPKVSCRDPVIPVFRDSGKIPFTLTPLRITLRPMSDY